MANKKILFFTIKRKKKLIFKKNRKERKGNKEKFSENRYYIKRRERDSNS